MTTWTGVRVEFNAKNDDLPRQARDRRDGKCVGKK
jgi:hypothetical protein